MLLKSLSNFLTQLHFSTLFTDTTEMTQVLKVGGLEGLCRFDLAEYTLDVLLRYIFDLAACFETILQRARGLYFIFILLSPPPFLLTAL